MGGSMIQKLLGARKALKFQRFLRRSKVTFFCLLLTFVVLRGTIGAGKFGTPKQDILKIRKFYSRKYGEPHRLLEEVTDSSSSSSFSHLRETFLIADSANYVTAANHAELLSNVGGGKEVGNGKVDDDDRKHALGPKISNWNERRTKWLSENPGFSSFLPGKNRPRVLLVAGSSPKPCENPIGDHYLMKFVKNKIDYSRLHGIDVFYNNALLDDEMPGFEAKLPLIRRLMLAHPEAEFLWWMNSYAVFTNMSVELPWERYKDYNLALHGWKNNSGSFLIRNCQWSLDLLDAWSSMGPKMADLLVKGGGRWSGKVYLEDAYYLHGNWGVLVDKSEEVAERRRPGDQLWPLVTHFVGKAGDYSGKECLKQMDRVFNVADEQVLKDES